jgi:hypothetical protein
MREVRSCRVPREIYETALANCHEFKAMPWCLTPRLAGGVVRLGLADRWLTPAAGLGALGAPLRLCLAPASGDKKWR